MKKAYKIILMVSLFLIVVIVCVFAYKYLTREVIEDNSLSQNTIENNIVNNVQVEQNTVEANNVVNTEPTQIKEVISTEPIFTKENYPKFDASTATQPLATAFMLNFTGVNIDSKDIEYTKTHEAYVKLIDKKVDLIIVTEPSKEELTLAANKNVELEVIPVVNEGFVFFVNEKNPIKSLTLEQIQGIYAGEIKNWKEVGGKDLVIRPFQRPVNSGSQTGMLSLVMKDKLLMEPARENIIQMMSEIINLVSEYDNGEDSIGYSYYFYANTMYDDVYKEGANRIRLLGINGVVPSNETIKNGSYPLQTKYYIVINKNEPENSNTRKLVKAMLSLRGQTVAEEVGYVGIK